MRIPFSLIFLSLFLFSACNYSYALNTGKNIKEKQENDTTLKKREHSPKKATYFAIIPGGGQIYNRKYWKLPIVYAGFAVTGYFGFTNRDMYKKYGEAYTCKVTNPDCTNELAQKYSEQDLISIRDYYRRNMELSFIIMGGWYILQMLDAMVDANLYYWEVDDEISISVQPVIQMPVNGYGDNLPSYNGLHITVRF